MEKQIGKLYSAGTLVVMLTGLELSEKRFAGVVVEQTDPSRDSQVGDYSQSWTWDCDVFYEHVGPVVINNKDWKPKKEVGNCQG